MSTLSWGLVSRQCAISSAMFGCDDFCPPLGCAGALLSRCAGALLRFPARIKPGLCGSPMGIEARLCGMGGDAAKGYAFFGSMSAEVQKFSHIMPLIPILKWHFILI